jgi:type IV secretion system protein VirB9
MMARPIHAALAALLLALPVPAAAEPGIAPNIRYVDFHPDNVVRLVGHTGYQIIMEFEAGEKIETVGIGDSTGWQVTPNGAGTVMFLKPVGLPRTTNMSIVTNARRYNLELIARSGLKVPQSEIIYALRFRYPAKPQAVAAPAASPPPLIQTPPELWNRAYSYDGAKGNVPEQVFDDGKATYFRFASATATPAIFSITPDAGESIVNYAVRGPYVVVEQVAPQFVLRQGKDVTFIFNDAYAVPTPGAEAPKERPKRKKGLFSGLFGSAPREAKP